MTVAFMAVGDEILCGETREGNGHALAQRLSRRGLVISGWRVVSDSQPTVIQASRELARLHALVIVSGGLGPTDDDGTRDAIAEAAGRPLVRDAALADELARRYSAQGRAFGPENDRQAWRPEGANVLVNRAGSAPGFVVPVGSGLLACLPGVPSEFAAMLDEHLDDLLAAAGVVAKPRPERTLRVFGIAESDLQGRLSALSGYAHIHVRSLPHFPEIRLALTCADPAGDLDAFVHAARHVLGWRVFSTDPKEPFAAAVVRALQGAQATLAVAESCTGGLIGHMLTDIPGVSATLIADAVCYANSAKERLAGVPAAVLAREGAVSEATARAMAEGIRRKTGADFGLATTGIAGPGGGTKDKPVGTVYMAVAGRDGTAAWQQRYRHLDRRRFKQLVAYSALARLKAAALAVANARDQSTAMRENSSKR